MTWAAAAGLLLGGLLVLMAIGLPVAFAFLAVSLSGAYLFLGGEAGLGQLVRNAFAALSTFALAPIPLFIAMGEVLFHAGLAARAIAAIDRLVTRVPGRLSVVAVLGGTVFSSLSGSTLANTAVLGSLLLPEMRKRGYHPHLAMGPIMAVGGIAMLVPPSALAVLLGSLAGVSISKLLLAGIVPGLIMSLAFLAYIVVRARLQPESAPDYAIAELTLAERITPFLRDVVPLLGLFALVVGSILAGWATPTESAALGVIGAFVAAAAYGRLSLKVIVTTARETARVSAMILFIIVASVTFSQVLAFSGATDGFLRLVLAGELSQMATLAAMLAVLLLLGAVMDQVSMVMITLPFFLPLAAQQGIDPLWLSVLMLIAMEVSFMTPPFGLLLYVMRAVAPDGTPMGDIWLAAAPFIGLEMLVLLLVVAWPEVALYLPTFVG